MTAQEIAAILSEKYSPPDWAFWTELSSKTGYQDGGRKIDAFAIHLWKSTDVPKGYSIAFEIKISRGDFFQETKKPLKREIFIKNSHQFYFVVPKGLIEKDEIPENCGLIEAINGEINYVKFAQSREVAGFDPEFVASMLKREDNRNVQDWKLMKFAGKEVSENDLLEYIKMEACKINIAAERERTKPMLIKNNLKIIEDAITNIKQVLNPL